MDLRGRRTFALTTLVLTVLTVAILLNGGRAGSGPGITSGTIAVPVASVASSIVALPPSATTHPASGPTSGGTGLGPSDPAASAMAYDAADGYVVAVDANLSGTTSAGLTWDSPGLTWTYAGAHWSLLNLSTSPPPLIWASMAYDARDGYLVLFGGEDLAQGNTALMPWATVNYTWTYAHGVWTNLSSTLATAPPATTGSQMVYDASDGEVVLNCPGTAPESGPPWGPTYTWTFANGTWTNVSGPENALLPSGGGIAYDPGNGTVLYFGGQRPPDPSWGGTGAVQNTTWSFHNGTWTNLTSSVIGAPPPRAGGSIAYDPTVGSMVLFGGENAPVDTTAAYANDSWSYRNGTWSPLPMVSPPSPRGSAHLIYDAADRAIVLSGGFGAVPNVAPNGSIEYQYADYADTWSWDAGNWTLDSPSIVAARATVDTGTPLQLDVSGPWVGSGGRFAFIGLPPGCASENAASLSCTPNATGSYRPSAEIVTGVGSIGWAATSVHVNAAPVVLSFAAAATHLTLRGTLRLHAVADRGTGPLSFSYIGLPPGCPSRNSSDLVCQPTATGSFLVTVLVSDALGGSATRTIAVQVASGPASPLPIHGARGPGLNILGPVAPVPGNFFATGLVLGLSALVLVGLWGGWRVRLARQGDQLARELETSGPDEPPGHRSSFGRPR